MTLAALNLWSPSPEADAAVLGGLLEADPRRRDSAEGAHFTLQAGTLMLAIHPRTEARAELAFLVADVATALDESNAKGCALLSGPTETPYGISVHLDGPGQTGIELVQKTNAAQEGRG